MEYWTWWCIGTFLSSSLQVKFIPTPGRGLSEHQHSLGAQSGPAWCLQQIWVSRVCVTQQAARVEAVPPLGVAAGAGEG